MTHLLLTVPSLFQSHGFKIVNYFSRANLCVVYIQFINSIHYVSKLFCCLLSQAGQHVLPCRKPSNVILNLPYTRYPYKVFPLKLYGSALLFIHKNTQKRAEEKKQRVKRQFTVSQVNCNRKSFPHFILNSLYQKNQALWIKS